MKKWLVLDDDDNVVQELTVKEAADFLRAHPDYKFSWEGNCCLIFRRVQP